MGVTKRVVVVGVGVSGLTTALVLARHPEYSVTVVGKHFPGDEAPEYSSPWAGANYLPVSTPGSKEARYDEDTFDFLWELALKHPESGVDIQDVYLWNRIKDVQNGSKDWATELSSSRPWFADLVPKFRALRKEELPADIDSGTTFKSFCINVPVYLQYLYQRVLDAGVTINRVTLDHINDAVDLHASGARADVIINCTGISSAKLPGVADPKVYAARGQLVWVKNTCRGLITTSGTDDGDSDVFYVQPRLNGGTIIGGSYQKGDWNSEIDPALSERIIQRAVKLCPELTDGKGSEALEIVRYTSGLRPAREGGPRVEEENVDGVWLVHNYGHGGYGYQSSYGCSLAVEKLVEKVLREAAAVNENAVTNGH